MKKYEKEIEIPVNEIFLAGNLAVPEKPIGLVIFAHGSGSSRMSPRNKFVAEKLQEEGIATLLFDLLTAEEDLTYENRFDIELLATRLKLATSWVQIQPETEGLPIGYFGASTGIAAAIKSAVVFGDEIKAMVSRGGRPDLAIEDAWNIKSPTLLIVGENDDLVIELNKKFYNQLHIEKEMKIIPGATHLFEEPGTLEKVAGLSADWFKKHFRNEI